MRYRCAWIGVVAAVALVACGTPHRDEKAPPAASVAGAKWATPRVALPAPDEFYRDPDPHVRADQRPDANDPNLARYLDDHLAANPNDVAARAERGYQRAQRGDVKGSESDYKRARKAAADTLERRRYALWSHGWALLAEDHPEEALAEWQESERLHGGHPYWWPYTAAVALHAAGRDDEAVAYYAAAARSFPERWGTREAMLLSTHLWNPHERARAEAVYALWQAHSTEVSSLR